MTHRGLVALSFFDAGEPGFERWAEALIGALGSVSSAESEISSWRIVLGHESSAAPAADAVRAAEDAARAAGGRLSLVAIEAGDRSFASLAGRLDEGDSLFLALASDVLILPSTVRRLIRAHDDTGAAVAARTLPWDGDATDSSCVLAAIADLGTASSTALPCPEAVVFRDRSDAGAAEAAGTGSPTETPSLSIVMRTQLRRPEALRDVLLCLAAQLDGRFELLLVVHDRDVAPVESLLEEQPAWLRQRTRVLPAAGGTRSRPLNVGFEAARGTHLAVLDDDDVVTSRWVARFLESATANSGRLLRAVVGVQQVAAAEWRGGIDGHAPSAEVEVPYPPVFDLVDHLRVNMTPFMAFAFPRTELERLGGADETLEVCEDWDLVLRCAATLGVVDIPHLTAIYRRWTTGDDSYSLHDDEVWRRDMLAVRAKLDAMPLLLPPGSATELAELSELRARGEVLAGVYASSSWRVTRPLRALSRLLRRGSDPR